MFFKRLSRSREILRFSWLDHHQKMRINNRIYEFRKKVIAIGYVNEPRNIRDYERFIPT